MTPIPLPTPFPRPGFQLTVLGSGTCTPSLFRQTAGYLVEYRQPPHSFRMLIDSGSGTIERLFRQGVPIHSLDAILYTHLHLDHTGDLFPLLFALRNSQGFSRTRDLPLYGPPGFRAFYDHLFALYGRWVVSSAYRLPVHELGLEGSVPCPLGPLSLQAIPMRHTPNSMGYRLMSPDGRVIAFTGDADESPNLVPLFQDATLAVVDCSTGDSDKLDGHLSPTPIGQAAAQAQPQRLLLSHFYPSAEGAALETTLAQHYRGPVQRAYDGLRLEID